MFGSRTPVRATRWTLSLSLLIAARRSWPMTPLLNVLLLYIQGLYWIFPTTPSSITIPKDERMSLQPYIVGPPPPNKSFQVRRGSARSHSLNRECHVSSVSDYCPSIDRSP